MIPIHISSSADTSTHATERTYPAHSAKFAWVFVALSAWMILGIFVDGWAHTHGQTDSSFFTPWHAMLYSGFLVFSMALASVALYNWRRGYAIAYLLPQGYRLSLIGSAIFMIGGIGDMAWHSVFGVEADVEALYSPTHLLLTVGGLLIASGAWRAPKATSGPLSLQLPMLLSLTLTLSLFTFFLQTAHPLANLWGVRGGQQATLNLEPMPLQSTADHTHDHRRLTEAQRWERELGMTGIILDSALTTGVLLLLLRRKPARGAFTLVIGLNAVLMGVLYDVAGYPVAFVIARILAGLVADTVYAVWRAQTTQGSFMRNFVFVVVAAMVALYFGTAALMSGFAWSIHLWAGSIVISGITAWLMGYIAAPATQPIE